MKKYVFLKKQQLVYGACPDSHVVLFLISMGFVTGAKMKPLSECHWWKNYWINALP